ncbi:Cytochrome bo(3) ubiquinol oxidase subunit 2 [Candidatus Pandoraea novymonadis]|uniref:Ubiquinol oxidase polypeptide II n=2 Tax=Candidatus Pandoraea novymonadis TaxID=1808959 RepID=A0ABX5FEG5_9BURK|nr:Cytochrome bo(3) ubiquinol oxidase subunit 2 [Candidatus Pandoraea novymonadis]
MAVLNPKGLIGEENKSLILTSTFLMLIVVIPVIFLTLYFAWKYRARNTSAKYEPKWCHSTVIEVIVWAIPVVIVTILAKITWISTHELDPYKPLDHRKKPITIQVVSMNWKWLFIYPEQKIATINQLAIPVDTPVNFKITSESIMNSFFIPQLGSQIYSMAGMETKLHLIANEPGIYDGLSANYSGAGFSGMRFKTLALSEHDFHQWIEKVRSADKILDNDAYQALVAPKEKNTVTYYSSVDPYLYLTILHTPMVAGTTKGRIGTASLNGLIMPWCDDKTRKQNNQIRTVVPSTHTKKTTDHSLKLAMEGFRSLGNTTVESMTPSDTTAHTSSKE